MRVKQLGLYTREHTSCRSSGKFLDFSEITKTVSAMKTICEGF